MNKISFSLLLMLISGIVSAQPDSVRYHDGDFESQYGASGAYPGTDYMQCVVRFTPPYYPAQLTGIRTWFRNAITPAPFSLVVYTDPAGNATGPQTSNIYISSSPISNPASGGIPDTAYDYFADLTSSNIILSSGDVYAGATQYSQTNGFFGMTIDANSSASLYDRSWISTSQGAPGSWWQMYSWTFNPGVWGVTAYFTSLATDVSEAEARNEFYLCPNPARDRLAVGNMQMAILSMEIFDVTGNLVLATVQEEENRKQLNIDVSKLNAGFYFIKLNTEKGERVLKFIRE